MASQERPSPGPSPSRPPVPGPSALPSVGVRLGAFLAVVISGLCGLTIGRSLVELQCEGDCGLAAGGAAILGALVGSVGVAIVVVLVMRAMGDWRAPSDSRR